MKILAIDPGYERLGIAVLERKIGKNQDTLLFSECFKTSAKIEFSERLALIGRKIEKIIEEFSPSILAIETLFLNTNQKTAMRVAEARGVIIYEAARKALTLNEYTPLQIKIAVTSHGRSDKRQIIAMIPRLIKIDKEIAHDDEYDAIACGITCLASQRASSTKSPLGGFSTDK
jgi:crossover junction endodeoxyribonuclease RuvC